MKIIKLVIAGLVISFFILMFTPNAQAFNDGDGSELDPYVVTNCEELQQINDNLTAYYKLNGTDGVIDCSMTNPSDPDFQNPGTWDDESGFNQIGSVGTPFAGFLDGNNNVINGLYINKPSDDFVGLFSAIDAGSSLSNFGLNDIDVTGSSRVGGLVGSLSGTLTNVFTKGQVHGYSRVGGIAGTHVNNNSFYNSSPLVYTWNGEKYIYTNDVGNFLPKEATSPTDAATINKGDLVPSDGKYSMKISEEYNEIVYFDKLSLSTYDHAPGYDIAIPLNRTATAADAITVSDTPTNPLLSCTDKFGNDCLNDLKDYDDKWAYTDKDQTFLNTWILDFGDLSGKDNIQLIMRAARDYDVAAKMRDKGTYSSIRTVQVKNALGNWVEIYNKNDLGSDGTPRLRSINLKDKFLTNDYHVKVGFDTMYVNYFEIDTSPQVPVTINTYEPTKADLSFRGFTDIRHDPYVNHDYNNVSPLPNGTFKAQYGNFTKYGTVLPLLQSLNNQFVIMKGGDHLDIEFPYNPPAEGMERSFVLNNDVFYKHASNEGIDLLGKTVDPLPYIGMTSYTLATNGYPMTEENIDYLNTWNTRSYPGTPTHDRKAGSTIINSYSNADVSASWAAGGLVGYNEKEIRNSYATGNINISSWSAGGLVGMNGDDGSIGWIHDSYAKGSVSGIGQVGGLVGYNYANIERSYSTGSITADYTDYAHGLVGSYCNGCTDTSMTDSFWDTETSGTSVDNSAGTGKTTSEMKNVATFTSLITAGLSSAWDFINNPNDDGGTDDIWTIDSSKNDGYPYLSWSNLDSAPALTEVTPITSQTTIGNAIYHFTTSQVCDIQAYAPTSDKGPVSLYVDTATPSTDITAYLTGMEVGGTYSFSFVCVNANGTSNTLTVGPFTIIDIPVSRSSSSGTSAQGILRNLQSFGVPTAVVPSSTVQPTVKIPVSFVFTHNLKFGMKENDVATLQKMLISLDLGPAAKVLAAKGAGGYFGTVTKNALKEFQRLNHITPVSGTLGPITRAYIQSHI